MKNAWKYLVVGAAGVGAVALYKKYNPDMVQDIKKSVKALLKLLCFIILILSFTKTLLLVNNL